MSDEPVICDLVCVSKGPLLSSIPESAWTQTLVLGAVGLCQMGTDPGWWGVC